MHLFKTLSLTIALGTSLGACAHYGSAAGEVAVSPDVAASTTVLHVKNDSKSDLRVYAVVDGKDHALGRVHAHAAQAFVINPNLVGEAGISFSAREANADESTSVSRGPYLIDRGRTIEFVVADRDIEDLKHTTTSLNPPRGRF